MKGALLGRFFNLTTTATMVGGTQLFEGAHLTGAHTHFCRNSGKCRDYALFGVIPSNVPPERFRIWLKWAPFKQWMWLKCAPWNIFGFDSYVPSSNNELDSDEISSGGVGGWMTILFPKQLIQRQKSQPSWSSWLNSEERLSDVVETQAHTIGGGVGLW